MSAKLAFEAKIPEDGQHILCQIPKLLNLHRVVTLSWIAIIQKHFADIIVERKKCSRIFKIVRFQSAYPLSRFSVHYF
jgi:hypothetical protein